MAAYAGVHGENCSTAHSAVMIYAAAGESQQLLRAAGLLKE